MSYRFPLLACAFLALAPEGHAQGGSPAPDAPVVEIVSYRLVAGVDEAAYLEAAAATEAFLRDTGAVRQRYLTVDETGLWTDVIEWTSYSAAKEAEAKAMSQPELLPFFEAADPDSMKLRHATIRWRMDME